METLPDRYEMALALAEKGLACIPCGPGTKVPLVKWKEWQGRMPPSELLREWFLGTRNNIAVICTGLVIFDCDDPAKADLVIEHCGETPVKVRTPRGGIHLPYRRRAGVFLQNRVKIKGLDIDIRTNGGLAMQPFSETEHGRYLPLTKGLHEISSLRELPVANIGWTRERTRRRLVRAVELGDADDVVQRARAYLACIEGAISGQRGHDRTMRVAGVLIQKFGLTVEQALPLFCGWNEQCEPPWSEKELLHKLQDAYHLRFTHVRRGQP